MHLKRFFLILLCVLGTYSSYSQTESALVRSRILILLDESSSMIQPWASGKEKYKAAREVILRLMDSVYAVNKHVEFSLRVFGHQHNILDNDCYDTKNEVAFSQDNREQMAARLDDIHPLGVTPLAYAMMQAAEKDIVDETRIAYSIILITDGGESCGGDICDVMAKLLKYKVYFKPYIVSLENDPSLKTTYACMGDFLQVTKEKEIPKAVSTIVEAFRPIIKISSDELKELQNIAANAPSVLKVNTAPAIKTPTWSPAPTAIINPLPVGKIFVKNTPIQQTVKLMDPILDLPKVTADAPPPPPPVIKISTLKLENVRPFVISKSIQTAAPQIAQTLTLPKIIVDTPVLPKTDKIQRLRLARIKPFNVIFVIEDHTYNARTVPPLPVVKTEVAVAEKPKDFKVETTDDKETTLSVFFTNGRGKFYTTTPQIALVDPVTKKTVKKFFRFVDPSGKPDPQTGIPPGVYNLTLVNRPEYHQDGIKIELNKNNSVIITVKNTSLSFAYDNAPGRPVKEFVAVVTERNKTQGRVQDQKCNEALLYEPGNYHIEINTFPTDVRNVDLDFDGETVITVDQPGFAKFTGDGKTQKVMLYRTYGDKFQGFFELNLNDPRSKHLQMQPGTYQVHYPKGPGGGISTDQVQVFRIKATQETEITIK